MQRNESSLAPTPEPKAPRIPDNHPDSMLLRPGERRTNLEEQHQYAKLRNDPLSFELAKAKLEKQLGRSLDVGYHPVKASTGQGWEGFTNGKLLREDLTASQKRRLDKEWNNWVNEGNKKIAKSLNKLGVDYIDMDWDYFRASYKK